MRVSVQMAKKPKILNAISLFTGAGGMDVGFSKAGFKVVWANELMPHAVSTYKANHPNTDIVQGSITDNFELLPTQDIDCVFGGPPCQGFSVAGKMDLSDPRSKLVFDFMTVVERTSPKCFVLENVKALAKLEKFQAIREELVRKANSLGYVAKFHLLNAKDFGVPQSRERVFFIGFKQTLNQHLVPTHLNKFKKSPQPIRNIFEMLGRAGSELNPLTCKAKITIAEKPVLRKSPYAGMLFNGAGRPINIAGMSGTLPASMGGNKTPIVDEGFLFDKAINWVETYHAQIINKVAAPKYSDAPSQLRRLTVREAALIQTFPDDYIFKGPTSSHYTQIGNAVPCLLAESVARAVLDVLNGVKYGEEMGQVELELGIA
jgi:DNA (cytosine-5)-methyltransferase 1